MEERFGRQLAITGRMVRDRFDGCLNAHGASLTTWAVLRSAEHEGGLSQRELASRMSIESPTHVSWPVLLTLTPLACISGAALGLTFGTRFEPRTVPIMFGVVVIPLTFLGCVYYSWVALTPVKVAGISWLKILVLVNPLVYMNEGFRAALTSANHMSPLAVYGVLTGFALLFLYFGINGFKKRVLS